MIDDGYGHVDTYSITENSVPNYSATVNGNNIVNNLTSIPGSKQSGFELFKTNSQNVILSNAKFKLYKDSSCTQPVSLISTTSGDLIAENDTINLSFVVNWDNPTPSLGDTAHFVATTNNMDGLQVTFQWQYSVDDNNWIDVDGETGLTMDQVLTAQNCAWYWRIQARFNTQEYISAGRQYIGGLAAGKTYYLKEIEAPSGFDKDNRTIPVTITATDNRGTASNGVWTGGGVQVINTPNGVELPETGGDGTTAMYIVGLTLLILASALLISKRKVPNVK